MKITQKHIVIGASALGIGYIFLRMRANRPIIPTSIDDFTRTFDLTPIPEPAPIPPIIPTPIPEPIPEQRNIFEQITDGVRNFIDPIIPDAILPPRVPERPLCGFPGCAGPRPRVPEQRPTILPSIPSPVASIISGLSGLVDRKRRVAERVAQPITQGLSGLVDTKRRVAEGAARTIVEVPRRVVEQIIRPPARPLPQPSRPKPTVMRTAAPRTRVSVGRQRRR